MVTTARVVVVGFRFTQAGKGVAGLIGVRVGWVNSSSREFTSARVGVVGLIRFRVGSLGRA